MFRKKPTALEREYDRVVRHLVTHDIGSEEYLACLRALDDLTKMMPQSSFDRNVLATLGANLLGLVMIIKHENVNVISRNALSHLVKPRI